MKRKWMDEALKNAEINQHRGIRVSRDLAYFFLRECTTCQEFEHGRRVQSIIIHNGLDSVSVLADHLIRLFTLCGSIIEANIAFNKSSKHSQYTWNAIISAHAYLGKEEMALDLDEKLQVQCRKPDKFTFLSTLRACGLIEAIQQGRFTHQKIIEFGVLSDRMVGSSLMDMYIKCGNLEEARRAFEQLPDRDVVAWSTMISGCAQLGEALLALEYFADMLLEGVEPDEVTFLSIFKACSIINGIQLVRHIHEQIIGRRFFLHILVGSTIIDTYAKCGNIEEAYRMFNKLQNLDVVAWNAMIAGYAQGGQGHLALECFENMQHEKIKPDKVTFLGILKACSMLSIIEQGRCIHQFIIEYGFDIDIAIGNTLIDMYAKCGSLDEAQRIFDRMANWNVVTWSAIITGYAQHDEGFSALKCFNSMQQNSIKPSKVTFLSILKACASIGVIEQARCIHEQIIARGLSTDLVVGNTLVDMYAKCGNMEEAHRIFGILHNQDVVAWGAMVAGYAQRGDASSAFQYFEDMLHNNIKPDNIAFTGIFTVCSRVGLVNEGSWYFKTLMEYHGLLPDIYHLTCIMDLLGRAGRLEEVECLVQATVEPNIYLWTTLLSACRTYGNMELGRSCFDKLVHLEPSCSAAYVLMSNLYAHARSVNVCYEVDLKQYAGGRQP